MPILIYLRSLWTTDIGRGGGHCAHWQHAGTQPTGTALLSLTRSQASKKG